MLKIENLDLIFHCAMLHLVFLSAETNKFPLFKLTPQWPLSFYLPLATMIDDAATGIFIEGHACMGRYLPSLSAIATCHYPQPHCY